MRVGRSYMEYEYKVVDVADGSFSSLLLSDKGIAADVLQAYLNAMAAEGWRMIFMEKVRSHHLLVKEPDTLLITFERRVPEEKREARAARTVDDVVEAEYRAKKRHGVS